MASTRAARVAQGKIGTAQGADSAPGGSAGSKAPTGKTSNGVPAGEYSFYFPRLAALSRVQFNDPPPIYRPILNPVGGIRGPNKSGAGSAFMVSVDPSNPSQTDTNYGFRFDYLPQTVHIDQSSSAEAVNWAEYDGKTQPHFPNFSSMSFQFLINRQDEVAARAKTRYAGAHNSYEFAELGTTYDIEFFYRVNNGLPQLDASSGAPVNSAQGQILYVKLLDITFSKALGFRGILSSVSFDHILFSQNMVPTVTQVSMVVTGVVFKQGQAPAGSGSVKSQNGNPSGLRSSYDQSGSSGSGNSAQPSNPYVDGDGNPVTGGL